MIPRRLLTLLAALVPLALVAGPASAQSTFSDVTGSVHETSVTALAAEGIVNGCDDDRYCPSDVLTRGQVASILANALGLELEVEPEVEGASVAGAEARFTDTVDSVHRAAIEAIADAGVTAGCGDGTFCPSQEISRGALATMLTRALELPEAPAGDHFTDADGLHGPSIDAMAHAGFAAGCSLVSFCPNAPLSRAHAATFVARALGLTPPVELAPLSERLAEHEAILAAEAAARAEAEAAAAEQAAREAAPAAKAVEVALAQLGKPYQWGGNGPSSFDCSGLMRYAWRAAGVELPRTSRDQYGATQRISRSELRPGDLVFYYQPIGHVAMYIGDGKVVESPNSGGSVRVRSDGLTRYGVVGFGRVR